MVKNLIRMISDQGYSDLVFILSLGFLITGSVLGLVMFATRNMKSSHEDSSLR